MRSHYFLICSLFLCLGVCAQDTPPTEKATSPAAPDVPATMSVTFAAADSQGNLLRDLAKQSVVVADNNHAAQIVDVRDASDLRLDLGIVLLASKQKFEQLFEIQLSKPAASAG